MTACKQQKESNVTATVETGIVMNANDSLMVMNLTTQFMDALKEKRYSDAVVMLHEVNKESVYSEPELLDNEKLNNALETLKRFSIRSYQFKDATFKVCYDNEVRFDIELDSQSEGGKTKMLVFSLKPVRYWGEWRLCLRD